MISYKKIVIPGHSGIDSVLSKYDLYVIESLADWHVRFCLDKSRFAMAKGSNMMYCDIADMPELADMVAKYDEAVEQEIRDLQEDVKFLKGMQINYTRKFIDTDIRDLEAAV